MDEEFSPSLYITPEDIIKDALTKSIFGQRETIYDNGQLKCYEACHTDNRGTFIGRVVEDSKGEFCRQIDYLIDFSYKALNEEGKAILNEKGTSKRERWRWTKTRNYGDQLTQEQKELNDKLGGLLLEFKKLKDANDNNPKAKVIKDRKFWINEYKNTSVLFMVVKRHYRPSAPDAVAELDPCVPSFIVHRSSAFSSLLASAIAKKEGALKWKTSRKEFYSRDVGKYVFSIETALITETDKQGHSKGRYNTNFSIDETTEEIPVTSEVMRAMEDLNKYWIPVDVFDEETIKCEIAIVEKFIEELKAEIEAKPSKPSFLSKIFGR